jgi:hypothetical protein
MKPDLRLLRDQAEGRAPLGCEPIAREGWALRRCEPRGCPAKHSTEYRPRVSCYAPRPLGQWFASSRASVALGRVSAVVCISAASEEAAAFAARQEPPSARDRLRLIASRAGDEPWKLSGRTGSRTGGRMRGRAKVAAAGEPGAHARPFNRGEESAMTPPRTLVRENARNGLSIVRDWRECRLGRTRIIAQEGVARSKRLAVLTGGEVSLATARLAASKRPALAGDRFASRPGAKNLHGTQR